MASEVHLHQEVLAITTLLLRPGVPKLLRLGLACTPVSRGALTENGGLVYEDVLDPLRKDMSKSECDLVLEGETYGATSRRCEQRLFNRVERTKHSRSLKHRVQ